MGAGFAPCWPRLADAWPLQALVLWSLRSSPLRLPQCVVRSLELILRAPPSLLLNRPADPVPPASETHPEACLSGRCRAPPSSGHRRVLPGQHWRLQQASLPPNSKFSTSQPSSPSDSLNSVMVCLQLSGGHLCRLPTMLCTALRLCLRAAPHPAVPGFPSRAEG